MIAHALARQVFERKHLIIVPNCTWTGDELDLLIVNPDLRVIDVEIKITRSDLLVDAKKDKWFYHWDWRKDGPWTGIRGPRRRREWPQHVWKHYYCMPEYIWNSDIDNHLKDTTPHSGVILMRISNDKIHARIERRSRPNTRAHKIDTEDAINIARLASLRMWNAYDELRTG